MSEIRCAFLASAVNAEIRTTKAGKAYLGLTVKLCEEDEEQVWVSAWDNVNALCDQIKPASQLYIEGNVKLRRWADKEGKPHAALSISANHVEVFPTPGLREQIVEPAKAKPAKTAKAVAPKKAKPTEADPLPTATPEPVVDGKFYTRPFDDPIHDLF